MPPNFILCLILLIFFKILFISLYVSNNTYTKEIPINTQCLTLTVTLTLALVDCPSVSSHRLTIGHRRSPSHRRDRYTISGPLILNQIQAAFRRDEIRRTSPTPQDEMRAGMSYFHETIWKGVPKFLRRVDTTLKNIGINECVPYNAPLIQFSSWMGGDRDGSLLRSHRMFACWLG
ncbi:unnamed protein product [Camellia sinensis]